MTDEEREVFLEHIRSLKKERDHAVAEADTLRTRLREAWDENRSLRRKLDSLL